MLTDYRNFCSAIFSREFLNKNELNFSSHLNYVATLHGETTLFNLTFSTRIFLTFFYEYKTLANSSSCNNMQLKETGFFPV